MKDENFIQCFLKGWENLTREEDELAFKRQHKLNQKFIFTDEAILKLRKINETLHEQAFRIRKQLKIIYAFQEKLLIDEVIDDYEVDVEMQCWNNRYYRRWNEEFYGNPFYTDYILTLFNEDEPDIFFTDNWNEYQYRPEHPLSKEFHCYFFHHLYDHTYLAWEDILRIEEIWIEVYATNQFFFRVPGKVGQH
jgi:hypothetical protein